MKSCSTSWKEKDYFKDQRQKLNKVLISDKNQSNFSTPGSPFKEEL